MKIRSVQVGPFRYSVSAMTSEEIGDDCGRGFINTRTCEIKIDTTYSRQIQIEVLWHEVKHAIHHLASLCDESKEEDYCTRAAPLDLMVLKDNPRLTKILLGEDNDTGSVVQGTCHDN